jgi:hypothetical protein
MSSRTAEQPHAVLCFRVYCALQAVLCLLCLLGGGLLLFFRDWLVAEEAFDEPEEAVFAGVALLVIGALFALPFLIGVFVPARRWGWVYGVVVISLSMLNQCCIPFGIPLLIFWAAEATRVYFGWIPEDYDLRRRRVLREVTDEE